MYKGLINKYGKIEYVPSFDQVNSDSIFFVHLNYLNIAHCLFITSSVHVYTFLIF